MATKMETAPDPEDGLCIHHYHEAETCDMNCLRCGHLCCEHEPVDECYMCECPGFKDDLEEAPN